MRLPLPLVPLAVLAAAGASQNPIGFTNGWNTSFASRIQAITFAADILAHVDDRDYRDWALDPADPLGVTYLVDGMQFWLQDQDHRSLESFRIVAYHENPAQPDFPDPNNAWFRSGLLNLPPAPQMLPWFNPFPTNTPIAWHVTITFPSGAVLPAPKGSKWFGVNLGVPATVTWPADGLSTFTTCDFTGTSANVDKPGPRAATISNGQLSCFIPTTSGLPTGAPVYPSPSRNNREQIFMELFARAAGGVCVAQTNQTAYPASNAGAPNSTILGGTTNFLSGLNPDLHDFNAMTPARADDIGFLVRDPTLPPNSLVFLIVALGPSPAGSLPLRTIVSPGSRGNVCIDFTQGTTTLGFTNAAGVAQFALRLTGAQRNVFRNMAPFDFWYQALVLGTTDAHGTGCGIQHF
jgi:hypothetical protein